MEYQKINALYKRYNKLEHKELPVGVKYGDFISDQFAQPEFEYLYNNEWFWKEKFDGTNIRIYLELTDVGSFTHTIKGKSEDASIPANLIIWIENWVKINQQQILELLYKSPSVTLYGEGVGSKIQSGGHFGQQHFKLFDVYINGFWLQPAAVFDIGRQLNLDTPDFWIGTIQDAIDKVKTKPKSTFGDFTIEGYVGAPTVRLFDAKGNRIMTKIKVVDFK